MRELILKMSMSIDGFVADLDSGNEMDIRQGRGGERLDRGDRVERQLAHHGQPQLPRHGRLLADLHGGVRAADEPDSQGRFLRAGRRS